MIADPHEFKAFVAMKIRVLALFGAVTVASFTLLAAPEAVAALMAWLHKLPPGARIALQYLGLALPAGTALVLAIGPRRAPRDDAAPGEPR